MTWSADSTVVTADSTLYTADGGVGVYDVPGSIRPEVVTQTMTVTQRGKIESALLIVLVGIAAVTATPDVKATGAGLALTETRLVSAQKGAPLVTIINNVPSDVVTGFDNFLGWPPPEPPFIQKWTYPSALTVLTSYAAYNPATDVIGKGFSRTPFFLAEPPFIQEASQSLRNLEIKPAPTGDITTQLRKAAFFETAKTDDKANKGAWHIALMPGLGPIPPPITPPDGVWPQPYTGPYLPCRGAWEIPGGTQSIWVIGAGCFLMTVATAATSNTPATFALQRVGTLLTSDGQVSIRDNGVGGTVVIVDGPNGYYYTIATKAFSQITDTAFLGADRVAFIDGWWVFNQPGTQTFYTPGATYSLVFDGSYFALKDGATDKLVSLIENKEELWLLGEKTTEIWYDAGGQYFAFQRLVATMLQFGCVGKHTVVRFNDNGEDCLMWFARTERGQNVVVKTQGFQVNVVSPPAINDALTLYTKTDDAFAFAYQEDGHAFYLLTIPSAVNEYGGLGVTWAYDASTDVWHQRMSYEPYGDNWNRHRSNCFLNFQNQRLVGDYQNGAIYRLDRNVYTDAGWPLYAWRRAPHIWDGAARERVFMAFLQIDFRPGTGTTAGLGYDPQAVLTISRDGGSTFGQELKRTIGRMGQYLTRVIWRRLSFSRDAVVDVKIIDPVNRDIVGATLKKGEMS